GHVLHEDARGVGSVRIDDDHPEVADDRMTEHRGQHRKGEQRHAEDQNGRQAVVQEPAPFAPSDEPESALARQSHRRCRQSIYALMPGRSSGALSTGQARISNVRRSKSPVARVARQLAYSPLVAISLTSTVMRRSSSAGMRTSKRSPSLSVLTKSSRRSKRTHRSLRSISVTSGTP